MKSALSDIPFKRGDHSMVIFKNLPVHQCENCREYLIEDSVMQRVDIILERSNAAAELEIVSFAA